jgi:DMSO/TMAO reductase YedYZ molybdopterin-dependent catalytic subunit
MHIRFPWLLLTLLVFGPSCDSTPAIPMHGGAGDDDTTDDGDDDDAVTDDDVAADDDDDDVTPAEPGFPDFITDNDDYFITRIWGVPPVDEASYRLAITGLVEQEIELTLADLQLLPTAEVLNTLECIGNSSNGTLVGTAAWEGFALYDLLVSLGIGLGATHARIECADGYWSSLSLDQIQDEAVIGALRMNGEDLPEDQGFPLRIVLPGYYGVKHPAWVTGIELVSGPLDDYYEVGGWDCSPPMPVDSKIFFPASGEEVPAGVPFDVGGAAFGGTRVDKVEVTTDDGASWVEARWVRHEDLDHVWVFWKATVTLAEIGEHAIRARATDIHGHSQPQEDVDPLDGTDRWPQVTVQVVP